MKFSWQLLRQILGIENNGTSHLERVISGVTTCLAIALVALLMRWGLADQVHILFFASAAASAFLVFTLPHGALSQPWPVLVGQALAAAVGISMAMLFGSSLLTAAIAVGVTVILMHYLGCLHPPGGATAFYFVMQFSQINVSQSAIVFLGNIVVILLLALLINNLFHWRRYPLYWLHKRAQKARSEPSHFSVEDLHHVLQQQELFVDISLLELQSIYEAARQVAKDKQGY